MARRAASYDRLAACRGAVCAINSWDSLSGWVALAALVAPLAPDGRFFGAARLTGGHLASVEAVASGEADLAAIDAVTWAHIRRFRPAVAGRLRVLTWTDPAPGLPFVTTADTEDHVVERLRRSVFAMLGDPALRADRETLLLTGAEFLDIGDYACVRHLAERAAVLIPPEPRAA